MPPAYSTGNIRAVLPLRRLVPRNTRLTVRIGIIDQRGLLLFVLRKRKKTCPRQRPKEQSLDNSRAADYELVVPA